MGPGNALPQYSFTPPRPPDPSNFGLYGGCYSRSDCYRLQGTHHFRRELTQFSSQPSYPPWPPSQTTIHGYVFPHQFPHLSAHLSASARPPPPASSAHHYHFQSYHFQQPTSPGHYPPSPPIDPNPQNTPYHFQHQPPVIIGHPTAPLSSLLPYHVASVYPNPQHESLNPPVNYPHSDSSISHHQTQSKANIISQSTLSFTYGSVFGRDRDGTPTTKRLKLIRVNQNLRVRSQILMKRKPLSKLARRSRTQIQGNSKTDRCGALLITSAKPNAFDVPVETSPASVPVMIVAAVIESTPKHLGQKTHMGNHVDMLDLNSQLQRLIKICIVKDARKMFDKRPKRDAVSWTSMISGYVSSKALALFSNMWVQPQVFNRVSSVCGTMHSTCYSPSLCGKRREYHALYMFDKMLPSDRMCNAGRTIIAPRSIRDKGGGLTNHREIFYASDYFGLPNACSQIHYTIRLAAVSEMAICFVSAKQDNGSFIEDKELEQSLSGHTSGIDSVSFDSSEVLVAIGAASGTIKLWDLEEAKIVCTLIDHRSNCISVDFHPFGEFFASHSLDTNLKIWDIRKKGCIHTYKGHTRGVNAIRFTPYGLWVVSGGEDNTVKLWDLTDGKLLHDFKCNEGQIQCIGFHPHEFQLATGSAVGTVNFWDLDTFELIGSAGPETAGVRSLIFSLDGRALLCGLHESLKVFSWEPIRCHDAMDVGLVTLQLPDHDVTFNSAEDAQNRVATYTLCQLFPDLPIHLVITAPYAALVVQWKEGETITNVEDSVKDRRATFVDSLLKADGSTSTSAANVVYDSDSLPKVVPQLQVQEPRNAELNPRKDAESSYLKQELENKQKKQKFKEMLRARAALPIAGLKGDILQLLQDNNVLVVCGETGSGKTTQVPQFILDDMIQSGRGGHCNIICTQPRRIAAISVADRVADERCEPSPGSNGSLVGYQVRLDNASNEKTKLLFCTTGILLRKFVGDRNLTGITHVIVDEVHERSLLGDFLLIVLKNLIEKQSALNTPKLKVILMSATVDSNLFSNYFGGCPVITAEGRTHPVTTYFLEDIYERIDYRLASDSPASMVYGTSTEGKTGPVDNSRGKKNLVLSGWGDDSLLSEEYINPNYVHDTYQSYREQTRQNLKRLNEDVIDYDLLEDLVCHVDETSGEGAILVFLPGVSEIYTLVDKLAASYRFSGAASDWILPLHSSVASVDQKKVFLQAPENIRKIIVATNIAETSITIDDVVYVIDCGKHKENRYNPQKKLSSMVEDWISKANARQRRGRAGRVKPGICFCLYTSYRFEKLMRPFQVPEMLRMPLVELCLQIKLLSLGHIKPFLSQALEPPREEAMTSAIKILYEVGALETDEELTPLGHHLAKLPVDVLIGKMMIYGGIFGCLSPILSISAFLSYKSPFVHPKDEKENAKRAKLALLTDKLDGPSESNDVDKQSDHLIMITAYKKWEKILRDKGVRAAQQFCNSYYLSSSVMYMIRDMRIQFGTLLADIGLIDLPKKYQVDGRKKENLDAWFSDASQPFNMYSNHSPIVKAIICAGLYPNIAATEKGIAGTVLNNLKQAPHATSHCPTWYDGRRKVNVHPSSINHNVNEFRYPFLVFLEKVETNKVFLRDSTIISPNSILLFGGSINIQHQTGLVIVDGWLKLTAPAQTAVLFKELRLTLHSVLKELIRKPENCTVGHNEVLRSIIHLLLEEDKPPPQ